MNSQEMKSWKAQIFWIYKKRDAAIAQDYLNGFTQAQLAKSYGVSQQLISRALRNHMKLNGVYIFAKKQKRRLRAARLRRKSV